jgi:heterodisulfide reductase subunit B
MSQVYAYYPGCTLHSTAKEYGVSVQLVCQELGIELRELEDWTCCGASSAHLTNRLLSIALPARELQAAGKMGLPLVAPCAMCYSRLKFAVHELANPTTLNQVREIIDGELHNTTKVVHPLEVLDGVRESIPVRRPLESLAVACYYGCLLVRPRDIVNMDSEENPQIMDRLMNTLGARTIDWNFKTECCGASLSFSSPGIVLKLSHRLLSQAKQQGADCIVVACPECHANLDMYQSEMAAKYQDDFQMPVLYFTQVLGLALGLSPRQLLLDRHLTNPLPMLESKIKDLYVSGRA